MEDITCNSKRIILNVICLLLAWLEFLVRFDRFGYNILILFFYQRDPAGIEKLTLRSKYLLEVIF